MSFHLELNLWFKKGLILNTWAKFRPPHCWTDIQPKDCWKLRISEFKEVNQERARGWRWPNRFGLSFTQAWSWGALSTLRITWLYHACFTGSGGVLEVSLECKLLGCDGECFIVGANADCLTLAAWGDMMRFVRQLWTCTGESHDWLAMCATGLRSGEGLLNLSPQTGQCFFSVLYPVKQPARNEHLLSHNNENSKYLYSTVHVPGIVLRTCHTFI